METDPRISDVRVHVDLSHLRALEQAARGFSLSSRQPARSALNGRHGSRIRGRGLNFEELRNYQKGDDIRTIDWKVTARTQEPHVRVYTEERDRPVLLLVDQRMSMFFGSKLNMKSVTAAEAGALAAWRVRIQGDRVGGLVFSDRTIAELRPKASDLALNRFLTALAEANSSLGPSIETGRVVDFNQVLGAAARIAKTGMMVLVISDFDGADQQSEMLVRRISAHNDVILFPVFDPLSREVPEDMRIIASDGSMQATFEGRKTGEQIKKFALDRLALLEAWERQFGIPVLPLSSAEDTATQLQRLLTVGIQQ